MADPNDTFEKLRRLKEKKGTPIPTVNAPDSDIKGADVVTLDKLKEIAQKKQHKDSGKPSITDRIEQMKQEGAKRHEMYAQLNQEGHRADNVASALNQKESFGTSKLSFFLQQYKVAILVFGVVFVLTSGAFFILSPGSAGGGEALIDFSQLKADHRAELLAQQAADSEPVTSVPTKTSAPSTGSAPPAESISFDIEETTTQTIT